MAKRTKRKGKAEKSAAIVSIFDAPNMTVKGRREIANWLRSRAEMLVKQGKNYAPGRRHTARYLYAG